MTEVLSKFVFAEPPHTALNKFELETIVAQRRAFNIFQTTSLQIEIEWRSVNDLLTVEQADMTIVYVLYEFVGETYQHLSQLKCRVIGPLVVLQSFMYSLKYPMRNVPTWSQSLHGQIVTAINFSIDDDREIFDKIIKLGGVYKRSISDSTSIIIVDTFNPNEQWFKDAADKHFLILRRQWLDKICNSAFKLEWESQKFFEPEFLLQYQVSNSPVPEMLPEEISSIEQRFSAIPSQRPTNSLLNSFAQRSITSHTSAQRLQTTSNTSAQPLQSASHTPAQLLQTTSYTSARRQTASYTSARRLTTSYTPNRRPTTPYIPARLSLSKVFSPISVAVTQSVSPEYISQGPVMSTSGTSSITQQRPVFWEDKRAKTSQMDSGCLRTHTQDQLDHFASDTENQPSKQSDPNVAKEVIQLNNEGAYMDDEERKLLAQLYGR